MAITINFEPFAGGTSGPTGNRLGSIDPRLSRTNYFDGQLLKASDLTRDQIYLDERLLELGQSFGSGIAEGLELSLVDDHLLRVGPGLAIAPSGRVLQLSGRSLQADLQNSALIATLNQGAYRRFERGLYAVALQHAEVISGVAEAYPADLASRRQWRVSAFSEGVELVLVALPVPLPRGNGLAVRAALARELVQASGRLALPSDDAIALGLLAIEQMRPQWLDLALVRRPLRSPLAGEAVQLDLAAHYRELFEDVVAVRQSAGQRGGFAASQYFRLLPPCGPLPKAAIDPVAGTQTFFPKEYDVGIAPVRRSDLPRLLADSSLLAPIDLERDQDIDLMVLVPLDEQAFSLRARQLEADPNVGATGKTGLLARLDVLALRLFAAPRVHRLDTDAAVWKQIWESVPENDVLFVRRPPRTAETNVSAVVLARGFALPALEQGLPPDLAGLEEQLDSALERTGEAEATAGRLTQTNAELRARIGKLEESLALGSDTRLSDALARVQVLENDLAEAQARLATMISGERNAAILATALAASSDKISELQDELTLLRKQLDEARNDHSLDEATRQQIEQLTQALAASEEQRGTLAQEAERSQALLAEARLTLERTAAELASARKRIEELGNAGGASDEALQAARNEIRELQAKLDAANIQLVTTRVQLDKALSDTDSARRDAQSANEALSKNLATIDQLQAQLNTQTALANKAQADLEAARKSLASAQAELVRRVDLRAEFSLPEIARLRGAKALTAEKLDDRIGDQTAVRLAVIEILLLVERRHDELLWASLEEIGEVPKRFPDLRSQLGKMLVANQLSVPEVFVEIGGNFGLSADLVKRWRELVG